MPVATNIKKVLVIGSGPIVIGQAAEFDYAGTQACRALREEGIQVALLNSNPATIMTDANMADRVYIEPLTVETAEKILQRERVDGIIATMGGQAGLNLVLALHREGILDKYQVPLLGTPLEAIAQAEDRAMFKATMNEIGEPVPDSAIVTSWEEARSFARQSGFPLIVRPAYTLAGSGGGQVQNHEELQETVTRGLKASPIGQALIERSVAGYKEIEFEVMRDHLDNCITVCSMENIDPVGIHTGDSMVVAPAQTLTDGELQMLRDASLKIIRALRIAGGCNIQFALDPYSRRYYVIEVNPRVSRSSALASKATGYPIAKVAARIAIGYSLDEIPNAVTGKTMACFEPAIDYVVLKMPRWPFDKFAGGERRLGTQMKATGEVMAIDRSFEGALLKAVRSLDLGIEGLNLPELDALEQGELERRLRQADDQRLFIIAAALARGMEIDTIHELTAINRFFLHKIKNIIEFSRRLQEQELDPQLLREAKVHGFTDQHIARLQAGRGWQEGDVRRLRHKLGMIPAYKMVDTCAAEFEAASPYFYSSYEQENEALSEPDSSKVLVVGSGPIRIGQGIEFDYCSVHCAWALQDSGRQAVIVNNNPETVSTDFDTSDRLYFEPLSFEDVMNIIEQEWPEGAIVQFGGQNAINLAGCLNQAGVKILGTCPDSIDRAEDRERFDRLLQELGIPRAPGRSVTTLAGAVEAARSIGYPVLVRPSYVLGGRAMEIVDNQEELERYITAAVQIHDDHPVLVDKYLLGQELEVDAVADGQEVLIPGIMQHIERAGIHSGDSMAVFPAYNLKVRTAAKVVDYTTRLALALQVKGMINIQFVEHNNELYVIEVNPRSSRTVPFISKVTGLPLVKMATLAALGRTLAEQGYTGGLQPRPGFYSVKVPVFSFGKLEQVDVSLGPEMKSTGEVLGMDKSLHIALYKGMLAAGMHIPDRGTIVATIADRDKEQALPLLQGLARLGYKLVATEGTACALERLGIAAEPVRKLQEGSPNIIDLLKCGQVDLIVNTLTQGRSPSRDGFQIRRTAVELNVPVITSLDTLQILVEVIREQRHRRAPACISLQEYASGDYAWVDTVANPPLA